MYYNSCNNREALVSVVRRPPHLEVERLLVPFECIVLANLYLPNLQKRHLVHASHNVTLKEPPTRLFTERGRVLCDRFNQATSSKRRAFVARVPRLATSCQPQLQAGRSGLTPRSSEGQRDGLCFAQVTQ